MNSPNGLRGKIAGMSMHWSAAALAKASALYHEESRKLREAKSTDVRIAILGSEASGKTVFITALAHHFRENMPGRPYLDPANKTANDFLSKNWRLLEDGQWPFATAKNQLHRASFHLHHGQHAHPLRLLDFAGEHYRAVFGDDDPDLSSETTSALWQYACEADITLILVSLDDFMDAGPQDRRSENEWAPKKIMDLAKARGAAVAVVFTKADRFRAPLADQATWEGVFRHYLPATYGTAPQTRVFPISAVNRTVESDGHEVPAKSFGSEGFEEMLGWVSKQADTILSDRGHDVQTLKRKWLIGAMVATAAVWLVITAHMIPKTVPGDATADRPGKVIGCSKCSGTGLRPCKSCSGGGITQAQETCPHCSGKLVVKCPVCEGNRQSVCRKCDGTGTPPLLCFDFGDCNPCGGKGQIPCVACNRTGLTACTSCNAGRITVQHDCGTFNRTGKCKCDKCTGSGKLTKTAISILDILR
jgi:hypothetical protein